MDEETPHNVFNNGIVHVCKDRCSTCIFRPGNLMHLREGRVKEIVDSTNESGDGSTIVCHQTLHTDQNAVCRGWLDSKSGENDNMMRLARALDVIKEITP